VLKIKKMDKFEYLFLNDIKGKHIQEELNKLGKEGWELVNFTQNFGAGEACNFIFKRKFS
jgi:hypothetical protein